jgi:folylpolyglutamate synthase/dihydropteroate synthase
LAPFANEVFFCRGKYKGIPVSELQQAGQQFFPAFKIKAVENPAKAMQQAIQNQSPHGAVLATGSIYMLREALQAPALKKLRKNKK